MKNQFTITPDIVREYQHLYWKKAFRPLRILICIVALLVAVGFFYRLLTENVISIALLLCFLLVLGLFFILFTWCSRICAFVKYFWISNSAMNNATTVFTNNINYL